MAQPIPIPIGIFNFGLASLILLISSKMNIGFFQTGLGAWRVIAEEVSHESRALLRRSRNAAQRLRR